MDLSQKIENIIQFQINEEGLEETFIDFNRKIADKCTKYQIKSDNGKITNSDWLILSNKDFSLTYEDTDNGKETDDVIRPILFVFCYAQYGFNQNNITGVSDEIIDIINKKDLSNPTIKLHFISGDLEYSIRSENFLNKKYDIRKVVCDYMKKKLAKYSKRDVNATYDYLASKKCVEKSVRVLSRTRVTQSKLLGNPKTEGHVFSANLFDLVSLYKEKGKALFNKNIRYGLTDELDVDSVIQETLSNKPEEFWYLNNGITLILEKHNLNLQNYERINLSDPEASPREDDDRVEITVINGAQTLNSAAKFFYTQEDTNDAKNKAFVMLKVIEITSNKNKNENERVHNRIDQITISLNRQKPIITDDIAFTLPVIEQINKLREDVYLPDKSREVEQKNNKPSNNTLYRENIVESELTNSTNFNEEDDLSPFVFSIVRRGDISSTRNQRYTLKILPRVLCAVLLERPGYARTASSKSLIRINRSENHFIEKKLFPTTEHEDDDFEVIFREHYKVVNFAMALYEEIDKLAKDKNVVSSIEKIHEHAKIMNKYGKYLIIYSIVKTLKDDHKTFRQWKYTTSCGRKIINGERYIRIINELTKSWEKVLDLKGSSLWDSNAFKVDPNTKKTYENCKDSIKSILNTMPRSEEQLEMESMS